MKKRVMSIILILCMVLPLLPINAIAGEDAVQIDSTAYCLLQ